MASLIKVSSLIKTLKDCYWSLVFVQKLWWFGEILQISICVEESPFMIGISLEEGRICQLVYFANIAYEFLTIYSLNSMPGGGVPNRFRDESHIKQ